MWSVSICMGVNANLIHLFIIVAKARSHERLVVQFVGRHSVARRIGQLIVRVNTLARLISEANLRVQFSRWNYGLVQLGRLGGNSLKLIRDITSLLSLTFMAYRSGSILGVLITSPRPMSICARQLSPWLSTCR